MQPLVSVLILNTRDGRQTVRCVDSFLQQTVASQCEVIVIDNHSDDESIGYIRARLEKNEQVRIIENRDNLGFGGGYNVGVAHARGRYLLFNNPAKMMEHDGVEKMVARMERDPTIGILGPKMLHSDGSQRLSIRAFPSPIDVFVKRFFPHWLFKKRLDRYLCQHHDLSREQVVDWVVGGCFFIRRELFKDLGGFDERFFLFFEDTDLCRRVKLAAKKVLYTPSITVKDRKSRFSGEGFWELFLSRAGRIHLLSAVRYFGKWGWR